MGLGGTKTRGSDCSCTKRFIRTHRETVCLPKVEERILNLQHEQIAAICRIINKVLLHQGVNWTIYRNTVYKYGKLVWTDGLMHRDGESAAVTSLWTSILLFLTGKN